MVEQLIKNTIQFVSCRFVLKFGGLKFYTRSSLRFVFIQFCVPDSIKTFNNLFLMWR